MSLSSLAPVRLGQNLAIEETGEDQDTKRLFADAAGLVRSDVDVLIAVGPELYLEAAVAASRTIPIVVRSRAALCRA